MKTNKIYVCEIAEVTKINTGFGGVRVISYIKQQDLRLAIKRKNRLGIGEQAEYELLISGERLGIDLNKSRVAGDMFVTKATNLLMFSRTPIDFPKKLSKRKLLATEYIINHNEVEADGYSALEEEQEDNLDLLNGVHGLRKGIKGRREL